MAPAARSIDRPSPHRVGVGGGGRWTATPAGDGRRRQRQFVRIEAAEGGGGISMDVLDVLMI